MSRSIRYDQREKENRYGYAFFQLYDTKIEIDTMQCNKVHLQTSVSFLSNFSLSLTSFEDV